MSTSRAVLTRCAAGFALISLLTAATQVPKAPPANAPLAAQAGESGDPLRQLLEDSRVSQKGVKFLVGNQTIAGVVLQVTPTHVVARSTADGTIVLRLDRIDGVAGHVDRR